MSRAHNTIVKENPMFIRGRATPDNRKFSATNPSTAGIFFLNGRFIRNRLSIN